MADVSLFDLTGKCALVTGASAGIGRSCAFALARAGANVAIADIDEASGHSTAAEVVRQTGRRSIYIRCDVTDQASVDAMVQAVAEGLGRLDIAVNNAGIYRRGSDEIQTKGDWDDVIAVNLTGTWLCSVAEMKQMVRQPNTEGKIINVASLAAVVASSNCSYDGSKAAVVHMTKTLAAQWGRYNINVNCVSPGYVLGGIGAQRSEAELDRLRQLTPLGSIQSVEDLHGPIVFLASRASNYVTGQNILVDGGITLSTPLIPPPPRAVSPRLDASTAALSRP